MIGEGYRFEFTAPKDGEKFRAALAKLGVRVLDIPRDTATGAQAGTRPKA
jgi:hypothetical protein